MLNEIRVKIIRVKRELGVQENIIKRVKIRLHIYFIYLEFIIKLNILPVSLLYVR